MFFCGSCLFFLGIFFNIRAQIFSVFDVAVIGNSFSGFVRSYLDLCLDWTHFSSSIITRHVSLPYPYPSFLYSLALRFTTRTLPHSSNIPHLIAPLLPCLSPLTRPWPPPPSSRPLLPSPSSRPLLPHLPHVRYFLTSPTSVTSSPSSRPLLPSHPTRPLLPHLPHARYFPLLPHVPLLNRPTASPASPSRRASAFCPLKFSISRHSHLEPLMTFFLPFPPLDVDLKKTCSDPVLKTATDYKPTFQIKITARTKSKKAFV